MATILLVDDDESVREMLKTALRRFRHSVIDASSAKEALARFKPGVIDVVVTDILMPDEDGLTVIRKLRDGESDVKIVAISGGGKAGPDNYLNLARALGADRVIPKPFSINELIGIVEELTG